MFSKSIVSIASSCYLPSVVVINVVIIRVFSNVKTNVGHNFVSITEMVFPKTRVWFAWFFRFFTNNLFPHLYILSFCRIRFLPIILRSLHWALRLINKRSILIVKSWIVLVNPWKPKAITLRITDRNSLMAKFKCWEIILCVVKLIAVIYLSILFHQYHMLEHICRWNDFEPESNLFKLFMNSVKLMFLRVLKC